jgi:hypothetical protein
VKKSANPSRRLNVHSGKGFRYRSRSWFARRRRRYGRGSNTAVRSFYLRRRRLVGAAIIAIVALSILAFYVVR